MKKIMKKRIVFYCPWTHEEIIGAEEYDSSLPDEVILDAFHEMGKTVWKTISPGYKELWYLKDSGNSYLPYYKVGIDDFYIEVPTWWDRVKKSLC